MHPPKNLVTPAEAIVLPRLAIRDRLRPRPRAKVGLSGYLRWGLIDRTGREVRGGEQSNMILNQGLDNLATYGIARENVNGSGTPMRWALYAAVGTGSTEPAITQTALVSELARTSTIAPSGGPTFAETTSIESTANVVKEFDFAEANGNLTEWGMAALSSGALNTRELFRDELGDPVTITKTSDFKLRLNYTVTVTFDYGNPSNPYAFDITGIGTINGDYHWVNANKLAGFSLAAKEAASGLRANVTTSIVNWNSSSGNRIGTGLPALAVDAYVAGTYKRTWGDAVWNTDIGNVDGIRTIDIGYSGTGTGAIWAFVVDLADAFTKTNDHNLTLTEPWALSWNRG